MARYLADTNVLIDLSKGIEPVRSRFRSLLAGYDEVGVTPVNVTEFWVGLSLQAKPRWTLFFASLAYWPISFQAAARAGEDLSEWRRKGVTVSLPDVLIAAVAREQDATVLTHDLRGFPMPDVRTQSLRLAAP